MPPSKSDLLSTLAWLVEAGADEALSDAPVDRFGSPPAVTGKCDRLTASGRVSAGPDVRIVAPPAKAWSSPEDGLGSAIEAAARCRTLAELKSALEAFDGCALKAFAANTVFADGSPAEGIMCIGEAPGHEEDRRGIPFVGRAGKLLDKMLAAIGLDRTKVYIVNVLPWRPPENRNPEPMEVAKCIPFLRRHIELAAPKIILLLGAVAAKHVLGNSEGIMRLRGRWFDYHVAGAMVPVMPTLHPAYLLRRPIDKRLAWRDLQAFADRLGTLSRN